MNNVSCITLVRPNDLKMGKGQVKIIARNSLSAAISGSQVYKRDQMLVTMGYRVIPVQIYILILIH